MLNALWCWLFCIKNITTKLLYSKQNRFWMAPDSNRAVTYSQISINLTYMSGCSKEILKVWTNCMYIIQNVIIEEKNLFWGYSWELKNDFWPRKNCSYLDVVYISFRVKIHVSRDLSTKLKRKWALHFMLDMLRLNLNM